MPKYEVLLKVAVFATVTVDADNEDDAIKKAHDEFDGGLVAYAGNGGTNQLLGVNNHAISLEANEEVEYTGEILIVG